MRAYTSLAALCLLTLGSLSPVANAQGWLPRRVPPVFRPSASIATIRIDNRDYVVTVELTMQGDDSYPLNQISPWPVSPYYTNLDVSIKAADGGSNATGILPELAIVKSGLRQLVRSRLQVGHSRLFVVPNLRPTTFRGFGPRLPLDSHVVVAVQIRTPRGTRLVELPVYFTAPPLPYGRFPTSP